MNATTEGSAVVQLPADGMATIDFGNYKNASIHGQKFHDLNANGQHDEGEGYLNGWTIELKDGEGNVVATTVTAGMDVDGDGVVAPSEEGFYWFDNLDPGDYAVSEVLIDGWIQSAPESTTYEGTLVSGQRWDEADFGNYQLVSIHGRKFHDLNADGERTEDEPYLNDWTIELLADGQVVDTATTMDMDLDEDGSIDPAFESGWYWFTDVVPGTYTVREIVPEGWVQSAPVVKVEPADTGDDVDGGDVTDGGERRWSGRG